jgi:hypothetical protein
VLTQSFSCINLKFYIVNKILLLNSVLQGGSNITGTNCDLFTHNRSRSYLNHLVFAVGYISFSF